MAYSAQYIIRDPSTSWKISDQKNNQVDSMSNSLGSCFTDDHTDESDDEYWGRYDQGQIQTPINLRNDEESSEDRDYWAQYDGVGTETPSLHEEYSEQSTTSITAPRRAQDESLSKMNHASMTTHTAADLASVDMASVLTKKLTGVLIEEKKKEIIRKLRETREAAKEAGFSDQEYQVFVLECMKEHPSL